MAGAMAGRASGARRVLVPALVAVGGAAAASGILIWWRWLSRRRAFWRLRLSDAIPVHSAYWRARRKGGGDLRYVAIGDSAAQGIGASRPANGYVGFLVRDLSRATGRSFRVDNLAISGATVGIALERELPVLEQILASEQPPDLVTVAIGANDLADWDAARFDREIRELFARLPGHALVADLPSFYFLPEQRDVRLANRLLRAAAAERGLEVVPLHRMTDRQGLFGVVTQFAGDLFHPNDRGYRIWAAAFLPAALDRLREARARRRTAPARNTDGPRPRCMRP
ncbi:SGNH/GDSL hydrolase family protein [Agromyces seonyuensis]|uniref:SGNH/GDSL hydrolase family protein n=1 Tax=Agromyces seonyuensis TaxID=2662446 RepID=A0A6I4NZN9_9MICO|nr:SGNH/GDSL hydrolase family protein [Agromyces seonyuensis]MWB99748.1 SGNH/GDSL hydrolase family protein [Agromyces seonyuensis]